MSLNRRDLLRRGGGTAAALATGGLATQASAQAQQPPKLPRIGLHPVLPGCRLRRAAAPPNEVLTVEYFPSHANAKLG